MEKLVKTLDLNVKLKDIEGQPIVKYDIVKDSNGVPIFIRDGDNIVIKTKPSGEKKIKDVLYECLNKIYKGEDPTPELLIERGELLKKIKASDTISISDTERTLIKTVMSKGLVEPDIFMQVYEEIF